MERPLGLKLVYQNEQEEIRGVKKGKNFSCFVFPSDSEVVKIIQGYYFYSILNVFKVNKSIICQFKLTYLSMYR